MAYLSKPVRIPKAPGKITLRKRSDRTYVVYETGRTYNSDRKNTNPQRKYIGLQIRNAPTLMLPNENYEKFFTEDGQEKMTAKERAAAENYEATSNDFWMLESMFGQLYYEFQFQARRNPQNVVNAFKIQRINKVLEPLKQLMEDKVYARFLVIPEEPAEVPEDEPLITTTLNPADGSPEEQAVRYGKTKLVGLDYSDVLLVLTQYKGAINRFALDFF